MSPRAAALAPSVQMCGFSLSNELPAGSWGFEKQIKLGIGLCQNQIEMKPGQEPILIGRHASRLVIFQ